MEVKQIIVFKESRTGEGRVALTPNAVATLLSEKGIPIGGKASSYCVLP